MKVKGTKPTWYKFSVADLKKLNPMHGRGYYRGKKVEEFEREYKRLSDRYCGKIIDWGTVDRAASRENQGNMSKDKALSCLVFKYANGLPQIRGCRFCESIGHTMVVKYGKFYIPLIVMGDYSGALAMVKQKRAILISRPFDLLMVEWLEKTGKKKLLDLYYKWNNRTKKKFFSYSKKATSALEPEVQALYQSLLHGKIPLPEEAYEFMFENNGARRDGFKIHTILVGRPAAIPARCRKKYRSLTFDQFCAVAEKRVRRCLRGLNTKFSFAGETKIIILDAVFSHFRGDYYEKVVVGQKKTRLELTILKVLEGVGVI